jgi:hypothetical protein
MATKVWKRRCRECAEVRIVDDEGYCKGCRSEDKYITHLIKLHWDGLYFRRI